MARGRAAARAQAAGQRAAARGTRPGVLMALARSLALVALLWAAGLVFFLGVPRIPAPASRRTDAIVVLTGDGGRIARGVALLRAGAAPRLFISGVARGTGARALARDTQTPMRLFRCCVVLGHEATDTRSNAEETAAWVRANRVRSLRLVTSDYHIRRARLELEAELPPGVLLLDEPVPSHLRPGALLGEYHKWLARLIARRAAG